MQRNTLWRRQRQQVLLDYLRKISVHQAAMESVASMDDDAGAHGVCGQGRNVYTRERNFSLPAAQVPQCANVHLSLAVVDRSER